LPLRGALQREGSPLLSEHFLLASGRDLLSLVFNSTAGYAFAKLRFAGREDLQTLLAALDSRSGRDAAAFLMLNGSAWSITRRASSCRKCGNIGIFLVRQYALTIPDDSWSRPHRWRERGRIFLSIVLPVLKPILVTLAIFTFLGT